MRVKGEDREGFGGGVKDGKEVGRVRNDGVFSVKNEEGEEWIDGGVNEVEGGWKGGIPWLVKSEA